MPEMDAWWSWSICYMSLSRNNLSRIAVQTNCGNVHVYTHDNVFSVHLLSTV